MVLAWANLIRVIVTLNFVFSEQAFEGLFLRQDDEVYDSETGMESSSINDHKLDVYKLDLPQGHIDTLAKCGITQFSLVDEDYAPVSKS
ncbi:hypothetical protein V6N13_148869 [Hibiscus sabdariffa]|uniref:Uncharacterized protein n=1 Tax=Hibiscus sabdariffa TaxID=183260 RepID=A0ABR2EJ24_9ROSI